ncbi:AAA family ATPase [Candidatus Thiodictyon syntrophicum]|jgi:hypothetical protein|uniref:ATPase AAA-type core domain-containing protein n=1 Tax=Candidatus Thiodictyon syntrophicum TaxID=1166950 RepID=A0A2K8U382_9GAMM|nr:ATP-binding protein [Candidatus Thiodictyon syntrophicum]AUB79995.1 hypothetical protein THSYN_02790 [Candidatus Thiodictyon syntrophicum]
MLIELRVENHRSIRDEQALTMQAADDGDLSDPRPRQVPGFAGRLLPAAALYGANASGKSNVLSALGFMRDAVIQSLGAWAPDDGVPRDPFAWGAKSSEPSVFEVMVLVAGVRYQYGFVADDRRVLEEWLYAWPGNEKQTWLERDGDLFNFGEHLIGENQLVGRVTRPNALFLSAAVQLRHQQLGPLYGWFRDLRTELLRAADVGIVDMKIERTSAGSAHRNVGQRLRVLLRHHSNTEDAWLALEDESRGTRTLFHMGHLLLDVLENGGMVLIDELERSLHPVLALKILAQFNDPRTNPHNAQILFATHDTHLLGTMLGEPPLRRDQVWLTEKDPDGATCLYPLTDYKPQPDENVECGYLQGRYGAIPFLGDLVSVGNPADGE